MPPKTGLKLARECLKVGHYYIKKKNILKQFKIGKTLSTT